MTCHEDMAFLPVDVSHRYHRVRQSKRHRKSNAMQHLKDRAHTEKELAVETVTIRLMKVGDTEKEIEFHLPMGAVVNIGIEEEDLGKQRRLQTS
jgi:hypothetical protein